MILVDTNVVSEAMKPTADPVVSGWLNSQAAGSLYLSSVTLAELLFGLATMPAGRRKDVLSGVLDGLLELFGPRIVPFDADIARVYAQIAMRARASGKTLPIADGFIAATAASNGFVVATRDTGPFESVGLPVINPWHAQLR